MTPPTVQGFDYAVLDPGIVTGLRKAVTLIRLRIAGTSLDIIKTGQDFLAAKEYLDHGQFINWVEVEIGIAARTAQAYMAAAKLEKTKGASIALLMPTTIHRLAAKSAPPEVIDLVVERANAGEITTDRAVVDMLDEAKVQKNLLFNKVAQERRLKSMSKRQREDQRKREEDYKQAQVAAREQTEVALNKLLQRFDSNDIAFIVENFDCDPSDVCFELQKRLRDAAA